MCRQSHFCLLDVPNLSNARHIIFYHRMWYRALSLCYACAMRVFEVRASSSPPTLPLCQISFLLRPPLLSSPWRKIAHSITHSLTHSVSHSPSLFDAPGTEAFTSE